MLDPLASLATAMAGQTAAIAGEGVYDTRHLAQAAALGYLVGAGVPSDQAVQLVTEMTARNLVSPAPRNPMYHGVPWMVPGPVSGAPYYG